MMKDAEAEGEPYSIVVAEINPFRERGLSVLQEAKQLLSGNPKCIGCSDADAKNFDVSSLNGFLRKPFTPTNVQEAFSC